MKTFRSARAVQADVRRALAETPLQLGSAAPLDAAIAALQAGRNYPWAGVYLAVAGESTAPASGAPPRFLTAIKLGARLIGVLAVEPADVSPQERVFLKEIAAQLARYLTGRGRYLLREARTLAAASGSPAKHEPQSEREPAGLRAAAGESARS